MTFLEFKALLNAANEKIKSFTSKERLLAYTGGSILSNQDEIRAYIDPAPSAPVPFGNKIYWLAIRCKDHKAVADALHQGKGELYETNWIKGIAGAYSQFCFVGPPLKGWVLVVNPNISDISLVPVQEFLGRLSQVFEEVQFFAGHRGTGYSAFGRFRGGQMIRGFSVADGTIYLNAGEPTPIELELLEQDRKANEDDPEYLEYLEDSGGFTCLHQEKYLTTIAGNWSIDPQHIDQIESAGNGYIFQDFDAKKILEAANEKLRVIKLMGTVQEE